MKRIIPILAILVLFLIAGCNTVEEIKSEEYINKDVSVKGTAQAPLKIGELSGYTLIDDKGDKIIVSTERLPKEGDSVVARGTLKKNLLGYYIDMR